MNCPQIRQVLATSVARELTADQHRALSEHIQTCVECRRMQVTVTGLDSRIREWGDAVPVRGYSAARVVIRQQAHRSRLRLRLRAWEAQLPLLISSTIVMMTAFAIVILLRPVVPTTVVRPPLEFPAPAVPLAVIASGNDRIAVRCPTPLDHTGGFERTLNCQIDYTLDSTDAGIVSLRLVGGPDEQQRYFAQPEAVSRGSGQRLVEATIDTERLRATFGAAPLHVEAVLRASDTTLLASSRAPDSVPFLLKP